jgi:hypothetical protein
MDPRDKIYALLGITSICIRSFILPRYDMSVGEAYTSSTIASIKDTNNLCLFMAADRESSDQSYPRGSLTGAGHLGPNRWMKQASTTFVPMSQKILQN